MTIDDPSIHVGTDGTPCVILDKESDRDVTTYGRPERSRGARVSIALFALPLDQQEAKEAFFSHKIKVTSGIYKDYVGYYRYELPEKKALDVTSSKDFADKVPDIVTHGNPDTWILLCKASSVRGGWMKSTKAMPIVGVGVLVQVSTLQDLRPAEALTLVPETYIEQQDDDTYLVKGAEHQHSFGGVKLKNGDWL